MFFGDEAFLKPSRLSLMQDQRLGKSGLTGVNSILLRQFLKQVQSPAQ